MPYKEYTVYVNGESFANGVTLLHDELEIFDEWLSSNSYDVDNFDRNKNGNLTTIVEHEGTFELVVRGD